MIAPPKTRYAKSGDLSIAYQVVGDGPLDLVYVPGWVSHLDLNWEEPGYARFLSRLASFSRLILFDKRGTGLSDPVPADRLPTLEQRMDDVRAVLDAVGSERAAIFGMSEGGNMSVLFAATYPERTVALVTYGIFAKRVWAADYPWAPTTEERERWLDKIAAEWGQGTVDLETLAPSAARDPGFARWWTSYLRHSVSPGAAVALGRMNTPIDVRSVLPTIRVPTLVLHRRDDRDVKVEEGRAIAASIPGAKYVELPGDDHLVFAGDIDPMLDEIERFLTGGLVGPEPDRVLATVLFADLVSSTERAAALGDRRWTERLAAFLDAAGRQVERQRGRAVKTTGDGLLATFDGPARAVRAATAICAAARSLGLEARAGVHTGEIERLADDVGGLAVHIAARVLAEAGEGEVLASGTVKDLVAGSGLTFADRGVRALKGVPGEWRLFAAAG